jgi:hypothetical protein
VLFTSLCYLEGDAQPQSSSALCSLPANIFLASASWLVSVELGQLSRVHTFMVREMRARTRFVIGQEDDSRLETSQQDPKSKIGCKCAVITWRTVHEAETGSISPRETWSLVGGVGRESVSRALEPCCISRYRSIN